jgi:hypothetical protein
MSKQIESGAVMPMALSHKISRWDYDKSVEKMRPMVKQWRKATEEMLRELYLAREFFISQKGQYKDENAPNYLPLSWSKYCGEIGLTYQKANNWLRYFEYVPRELSPTGKDALMLFDAPVKEDTAASRALMQNRVNEVLRTGNRPTDWTEEEDGELKRQMKNAEYAELAKGYSMPDAAEVKDYFSDAMRRSKDIVKFKLEDTGQAQAQLKLIKYIEAYLAVFDNPETRALAALNLAVKTRAIANKLAEENFRLKEASQEGGGE